MDAGPPASFRFNLRRLSQIEVSGPATAVHALHDIRGFEFVGPADARRQIPGEEVAVAWADPEALHEVLQRRVRVAVIRTPEELEREFERAHRQIAGNEGNRLCEISGPPRVLRQLAVLPGVIVLFHTFERSSESADRREPSATVQAIVDFEGADLLEKLRLKVRILVDVDAMKKAFDAFTVG